jgi:hypothetical protein
MALQHPHTFIKVFVALLTATRAELGYDPRITMLPDRNFLYEMPPSRQQSSESDPVAESTEPTAQQPEETRRPPRFFMIKAIVSEVRGFRVAGRTSRILKVVEVLSNTNPQPKFHGEFILKDAWIDATAKTEAQIQEELFGKIEDFIQRPGGWITHPLLSKFDDTRQVYS